MTWSTILATLAELAANAKAIAYAYRLAVLSLFGLLIAVAGAWAFFRHPQGLIIAVLSAVLGYTAVPLIATWLRGDA